MSAELQDRLDAVGRLGDLARASGDPGFQEYASRACTSIVSHLDVAAIARQVNATIVEDYATAIGALSLTRRALRAMRGSE
jgi:hypothetical protein